MKRNAWVLIGLVGVTLVGCSSSITEPQVYSPAPSQIGQQEKSQGDNNLCGCPRPQPHGKSGGNDTLNIAP